MAKTIFQHGTPVTPDWLNSINNPVFDGQDLDGHRPPLSDAELDSSPDSVKSRVESLADWLKVQHTSGLRVQWSSGALRLANGAILSIPGNVATLPDNATTYFYVRNGGTTVERGASVPENALQLAIVVTLNGAVTSITDLRTPVFAPFDLLHGALSSQTQELRDRLDTLSTQVDSIESAQGDSLGGLTANLAGATAGDVIVVGAGGTTIARIPQSSLSGVDAARLSGRDVSLDGATAGDVLTIGANGEIIPGDSSSVAGIPFDIAGIDPGEMLGFNGVAIVPMAGAGYIDLGAVPSNSYAAVQTNKSYMFESQGSSSRIVIPAPKNADFLALANYGTNQATLDFSANAIGTSTGNVLLGSMSSIEMLSIGTATKDWIHVPRVGSPVGYVSAASNTLTIIGGGGGSSSGIPAKPLVTSGSLSDAAAWSPVGSSFQMVRDFTDIEREYAFETTEFSGNTSWSASASLGSTIADNRFTVVRVLGNLTVSAGATITAAARKLGLILFVTGDLTIDGTISMTARGANHSSSGGGSGITPRGLLVTGSEYIAATGGAAVTIRSEANQYKLANGNAATGGAAGGGGTGRVDVTGGWIGSIGGGAAGTCFSGGAGGGAVISSGQAELSSVATANGGPGGNGVGGGVGGTGNPGGSPGGASGTGGFLYIFCMGSVTISPTGVLSAQGVSGGTKAGASGGGAVHLNYLGSLTSLGSIDVSGGGGTYPNYGGNGGVGSIVTRKRNSFF